MRVNTTGITRTVFIFKNFVVKVPALRWSYNIWYCFLRGLCANIEESRTWKIFIVHEPEKALLLCPVIWCSYGGWILIMKKADVEKWVKESELLNWSYVAHINAGIGGDDKPDNYGYYENRLVKIDYPAVLKY